jgi:hypothetical protein
MTESFAQRCTRLQIPHSAQTCSRNTLTCFSLPVELRPEELPLAVGRGQRSPHPVIITSAGRIITNSFTVSGPRTAVPAKHSDLLTKLATALLDRCDPETPGPDPSPDPDSEPGPPFRLSHCTALLLEVIEALE